MTYQDFPIRLDFEALLRAAEFAPGANSHVANTLP